MAVDVSQRVIRYEGEGRLRRPVYLDEGPASAAIARQVGEGKTSLLDGLPTRELGGVGPVERTYLSAAELVERVVATPAGPSNAERMQASRQRGADRHVEVVAARRAVAPPKPPPEEEIVAEPAQDLASEPPPIDTHAPLLPELVLPCGDCVHAAVCSIRPRIDGPEKWAFPAFAYDVDPAIHVRTSVILSCDHFLSGTGARLHRVIAEETRALVDLPTAKRVTDRMMAPTSANGSKRSRVGEGPRKAQVSDRDRRAAAVMSAMGRLGDDMDAVAAELGMKKNAVAQIVKHARRRAEAPA